MGIFFKKVHNILLYDAGQFYVKNKMAAEWKMKICETFSGNSLKEDLSIDTTFGPCYFSWDSPFKTNFYLWNDYNEEACPASSLSSLLSPGRRESLGRLPNLSSKILAQAKAIRP